jgi:AraC-like DNA-binding protein
MFRDIHNVGADTPERIVAAEGSPAMRRAGMTLAGLSDAGAGYRMERRGMPWAHVLFCHEGRGRVWVDGDWRECGPGTAYLMPARVPHRFETLPRQRWGMFWLFYDEPSPGAIVPGHAPRLFPADPWPAYHALSGLYRESIAGRGPAMMDRWADLLHANVLRITHALADHDPLLSLWSAVDADLAHPWTLGELADEAGVSIETLRRQSLRQTGRSPMEHVGWLRASRAAVLLASTDQKVESVGLAVGYSSRFAFSAAFRRHLGVSPAEHRRRRSAPTSA